MMNTIESFPADWSEVPGDLLGQIIEKFISTTSLSDYIRFGAVCSSWRFFFTTEKYVHVKLSDRLPVLLTLHRLPIDKGNKININKSTRSFYSISEKKFYNFQQPVPYNKMICAGSSHGWLIITLEDDDDHYCVKLLNPFRSFNNEITLPPLSKHVYQEPGFRHYGKGTVTKLVLSVDPWPSSSSKPAEDIVVMGIHSQIWLGYCSLGDKVWTSVPCTVGYDIHIDDVIYYKGLFYASMENGFMVAVDVGYHPLQKPKVTLISPNTMKCNEIPYEQKDIYLMECSGDLLQVFKVKNHNSVIRFEVYKIDWGQYFDDHDHDWVRRVRVRDLNGFSLFLGVNASISLNAADFPGCKQDCIYFIGGRYRRVLFGSQDMGVFCLLDESFEPHYPLKNNTNKATMPTPIWIQPTQITALIKLITVSYEKSI